MGHRDDYTRPRLPGALLAQEYGHFLTARYRPEVTVEERYERRPAGERFAETFARAFLMPASGMRRRYLDLARERSGGLTYGDLCRLAHFYAVPVEAMARRLEELRLLPAGIQRRFQANEPQRLLGVEPVRGDDEPFSSRYVALAIEAWQREKLSGGQLARLLRTDRVGAREKVRQLELNVDFGTPLLRSAGR